jgi:hypothetical protein
MKKLIAFTKKYSALEILIVSVVIWFLFFIIFSIYTSDKFFILGGEGNYFLDVNSVKDTYRFSWIDKNDGTGYPNPVLNFSEGIFNIITLLTYLKIPTRIINLTMVSIFYTLPFSSMFWLLRKIFSKTLLTSLLLSLFYIANPFSVIHLHFMNFWNIAPFFAYPLLFGVVYKYYLDNFKLFFIFGLVSMTLAFSFTNPPYLGIFQIFIFLLLFLIPYLKHTKIDIKNFIKTITILEASFIFFNFWWLINIIRIWLQDIDNFYSKEFAINWSKLGNNGHIIGDIFSLRMLVGDKENYFFNDFYNNHFILIIFFIPIIMSVLYLIRNFRNKIQSKKKIILLTFSFILGIFFLTKGSNNPFGKIYLWSMSNIPFFSIFKSPYEKFGTLYVFIFTILLAIIFSKKVDKKYIFLLIIYLIVSIYPYFSNNFIPDFIFDDNNKYISRKFDYKKEYYDVKNIINQERLDFRYLSLPGSRNYQVTIFNHGLNNYYRGLDPIIYSINKPFIAAYSGQNKFDIIYNNLLNENIDDILNIFNIKKILINKNIFPAFGFIEKENTNKILDTLSGKYELNELGSLIILNKKKFTPHFYIPNSIVISKRNTDELIRIISQENYNTFYGVFFKDQNEDKIIESEKHQLRLTTEYTNNENSNIYIKRNEPIIEYKKINPTKYRIRIHQASGEFPVVFSETYHDGWKAYITKVQSSKLKVQSNISDYKILDGNSEDQASVDELKDFIQKGFITTLGNLNEREIKHMRWNQEKLKDELDYVEKYKIDFISKNFQDTIQNDNLPSGHFWETWMAKSQTLEHGTWNIFSLNKNVVQLPEKNHLMANGYANSWIINTNNICEKSNFCTNNSDKSYDLELLIEFQPQILVYFGKGISMLTILACLFYSIFKYIRRHSNKVLIDGKNK